MRVNVYAEEMTDRIEIIGKEIDGCTFTGLRFYLELPVTIGGDVAHGTTTHRSDEGPAIAPPVDGSSAQVAGPFMHRPGDDDSAAVTFWGKKDLRDVLRKMLDALDEHYILRGEHHPGSEDIGMASRRDYFLKKNGVSHEEYYRRVDARKARG
jgi:hypothetical protein